MDEKRRTELDWLKNRLKNISPSNRTLCLARLPRNRAFSLSALDECEPFKSSQIITDLIAGNRSFYLAPVSAPREEYTESGDQPPLTQITRSLTTLFRENESLIRNRGDAYFHFGFPFLELYTKDDNYFRAPLFLFPCSLKKEAVAGKVKKLTWVVEIDAEPLLNDLIFDAIEKGNGFKFDTEALTRLRELSDTERFESLVAKTIDFLKKSDFIVEGELKKESVYKDKRGAILTKDKFAERLRNQEINSQECSITSLFLCDPIYPIKKDELPPKKNLNLKLVAHAVIGQFPTYSSTLIQDYEDYLKNIQDLSDPIVDQIILGDSTEREGVKPVTEDIIQSAINVPENERFFVVPANSTQEQITLALRDLKQTGFVADGPPGTGKSQLIVNLVADNLAHGKKVLVVCEKRAALDVVYKRIQGTELRDHVLLIHSPEKERDKTFQVILDSINKAEQLSNNKTKAAKHKFEILSNNIEEEIKYLNEYTDELHRERENGLTLYSMYSKALRKDTKLQLDAELCEKYSFNQLELIINHISKVYAEAQHYYSLKMPSSVKLAGSFRQFQIPKLIEAIHILNNSFEALNAQTDTVKGYHFKRELNGEAIKKKITGLSEGVDLLNALERKDLVFKLMRREISLEQINEKILVLKSLISYLPADFRELPISHDTVDQECEAVNQYRTVLFETTNKLHTPFRVYKKLYSESGNHALFNKLTHYRLTPLLQEDILEICKYIENNKELIRTLFEGHDFIYYVKHKSEIEKFQTTIKIEHVLSKQHGIPVLECIMEKINYMKKLGESPLRYFYPKWHRTNKELRDFVKNNLSLTIESLVKIEELVSSNICYLSLKEYLKPLYSDLEITEISDLNEIYQAIESFKTVIKSLEALYQLYSAYSQSLENGISLLESHSQYRFVLGKYGIADDVKPDKILRDLFTSKVIQKNKEIFQFFSSFQGFPKPAIADTLERFIANLESQIGTYNKLAVVSDNFGIPETLKDNNFNDVFKGFLDAYNAIILYYEFKERFVKELAYFKSNFSDDTAQKLELSTNVGKEFESFLADIQYYLENYEAENRWLDLSSQLKEGEKVILKSLCELKLEDPFGEMIIAYCKYWIDRVESENRKIRNFSQDLYDSKRQDLNSKVDEKRKICAELISYLVKKNGAQVAHNGQLIHDLRLKRRKKNIRYVFKKYFEEIQKIFPVVLMAPENVSLCLPNKTDLFNLVIFDEASQLEVYKAIPSVFRGEAIFVTGDEYQLPPNRIGVSLYDDSILQSEASEDDLELQDRLDSRAAESFLDQCISRFCKHNSDTSKRSGRKVLDWHYRSEHEALINFSNHAFYKGLIQISPDPGQYRDYRCIRYHKVNGFFIKRRNIIEAKEVVRLLKNFWLSKQKSIPTIGVVTFSLEQQNTIWDEIDKESATNPAFAEAYQKELIRRDGEEDIGFFIRNIENVQGDERDVIIFSIGYAPEALGQKIEMQFGIFSREKGENRLNVAVTRAKKEVHIVSSIEPEELRTENTTHRGPKLLQEYLRYCRLIDGSKQREAKKLLISLSTLSISDDANILAFDSEYEQEVFHFLKSKGYTAHSQVGCSKYRIDLAVIDPHYSGRYLCGIECDGATYHSGSDARERDIYRQSFLESKNWKILRIWSSHWFRSPETAKDRLLSAISELEHESKNRSKDHQEVEDINVQESWIKQEAKTNGKQNHHSQKNHLLNLCPECGSEFKIVINDYAYFLYCKTCQWRKTADADDLVSFIEGDRFCKNHPSLKLRTKKSIRGLFLNCPSCHYVESIKIKNQFLFKREDGV